jgi:putative spermidine/putrescine transport system ATP-binding protein
MTTRADAKGIELSGIAKNYGRQSVLRGIDLSVKPGEFLAMLGPSGSGKTTLLKIIAGFEDPDQGSLTLGGRDMRGIPPERRNIGVVFQNYSLFPHMTIGANVGFPLRMRGMAAAERREAVRRALALVALPDSEARMPQQLSGGQQQRVAIARAIVFEPDVLLMDEPLGALDRRLRGDLQLEIKALHERLGLTIVYVTHDQDEALSMSDRVVVFNHGQIEQIGSPREVYRQPATLFVADFLGDSLTLSGLVADGRFRLDSVNRDIALPDAPAGRMKLMWRSDVVAIGAPVERVAEADGWLVVPATVVTSAYSGNAVRLRVRLATGDIGIVTLDEATVLAPGTAISLRVELARAGRLPVEAPTP